MQPKLEAGALVAGRYLLDRQLGEGGMGIVWAATHTVTRRPVALKLMKEDPDPERRSRFLREARAASAVRHPNVCEVHDVIELEDAPPMMVMEYLAGEPLSARLSREGKLPLPEVAAVFLPVLSAVGAAHALGIVHRDLKPENIFLTQAADGRPASVKVLDFGIAKLTATMGDAAATGALTVTGSILGTPFYMAPEQAFGEKDVDARADVWALGIILYRCLSGVLPTEGSNVGQIFKNIVARPIRPLAELEPGLPPALTALSARMLSRARKDRPADLHALVAALTPYTDVRAPSFGAPASGPRPEPASGDASGATSGGSTSGTDLVGLVDPLATTEGFSTPVSGNADRTPRRAKPSPARRRTPALLVGASVAAAAALALAGGAYLELRDRPSSDAPRAPSTLAAGSPAPSPPPAIPPASSTASPTVEPASTATPTAAATTQPTGTPTGTTPASPGPSAQPRATPRATPAAKAKPTVTSNPLDRQD